MKNASCQRIEVNVDELDRVLDGARQAPLSEADYRTLKTTIHALIDRLRPNSPQSEKMSALLEGQPQPASNTAEL